MDELLAAGFICQNGRVLELTEAGKQAARLLAELAKLEQTQRAATVSIPELEKAVLKTISEFVGRPFPTNMCIRPYLGYVIRDAFPGVEYTDAERRPYSVVIGETPSRTEPIYEELYYKRAEREHMDLEWVKASEDPVIYTRTVKADIADAVNGKEETEEEKLARIERDCTRARYRTACKK